MKRILTILVSLLFFLSGCTSGDKAQLRAKKAEDGKGPIVVGVSWPHNSRWKNLSLGVKLAADEVNAEDGINGRKIKVVESDDKGSIDDGLQVAEEFSNNLSMIAVIGHINSHISVPTAPIYNGSGMIMLTPGSTSNKLTLENYKNVFRMVPSNDDMGKFLAHYSKDKGYRKILIFYSRNEYGRDLANAFEKQAIDNGLEIIDRRSFLEQSGKYTNLLKFWKMHYRFDAMFLISSLPVGAQIIKQIREVGINVPIFSADALDGQALIDIAGKASEGTTVISFIDMDGVKRSEQYRRFERLFKEKNKHAPDLASISGYDTMGLLLYAIKGANSVVPAKISSYLHSMPEWQGIVGKYKFDAHGNLTGSDKIKQKIVRNGKFEILKKDVHK